MCEKVKRLKKSASSSNVSVLGCTSYQPPVVYKDEACELGPLCQLQGATQALSPGGGKGFIVEHWAVHGTVLC